MSLGIAIFSIIMMAVVFATGAYVGYCALGGVFHQAPRELPPAKPPEMVGASQLVGELRSLIDRLEKRVEEHEQQSRVASGNQASETALAGDGKSPSQADGPGSASKDKSVAANGAAGASTAPAQAFAERRSKKRHVFTSMQWIAPYDGCEIPNPSEFINVQSCDISSVGMSFFLEHRPHFQMIVVRLAGAIDTRFLTARIRRVNATEDPKGFIVGCRFLGTLHSHALPSRINTVIHDREEQSLLEEPAASLTPA